MKLPKFYNPFKPHIVQFTDGKFAVRRHCLIGWGYKQKPAFRNNGSLIPIGEDAWWYIFNFAKEQCFVNTYEEAVFILNNFNIPPNKVVKVCT